MSVGWPCVRAVLTTISSPATLPVVDLCSLNGTRCLGSMW
jgi:hypothetical protein